MLIVYFIKSPQQSSLPWMLLVQNKFSMHFNKPTGCGYTLNFMHIDCQISENMDTQISTSHTMVTLNEGLGYPNWYQNVELSGPYHIKFERNQSEHKPTLQHFLKNKIT